MQSLVFLFQSSDGETEYPVTVERRGSEIVVFCKCRSGFAGKLCRHKTELLHGDYSAVLSGDVQTMEVWKQGTLVEAALEALDAAIESMSAAKTRKDKAEHRLRTLLRGH